MRRHDLLTIDPQAWTVMLQSRPELADLPLVAGWAKRAWPVIVRRRLAGDTEAGVPAALPLPPRDGKQRIGFTLVSQADARAFPAVLLREAVAAAPAAWQPTIAALIELGQTMGVAPRVFGSLLWEHLTGQPYLNATSDLDLLWPIEHPGTIGALVAALARLDAASPIRIDGELLLPDGGGVNWRELAQARASGAADVLVKTMDGVEFRTVADLFEPAGAAV